MAHAQREPFYFICLQPPRGRASPASGGVAEPGAARFGASTTLSDRFRSAAGFAQILGDYKGDLYELRAARTCSG
jgi:hypothetical protein